jgi:hypothetical protein
LSFRVFVLLGLWVKKTKGQKDISVQGTILEGAMLKEPNNTQHAATHPAAHQRETAGVA